MIKYMPEGLKDATSNYERRILALIEDERKNIAYGKITMEISIQNNKITIAEITSKTKSVKVCD